MKRAKEERKTERVRLYSSKNIYDLSEGGVFIRTEKPKPAGSIVAFELRLFPDKEPIRVKGRVLRAIYKSDNEKVPVGMAVQFTELAKEGIDQIRLFVAKQKNLLDIPVD